MSRRDRDKRSANLYVGNISSRTRESDLRYKFEKFGRLRRCDLLKGFGFVEFDDAYDAEDARDDLDGYEMDGRRLQVEFARSKGDRERGRGRDRDFGRRDSRAKPGRFTGSGVRGGAVRGDRKYCVKVSNIASSTTWQELKDFARDKIGNVEYADIWNEGRTKFGVVKFLNDKDYKYALKHIEDSRLDGNYLRLENSDEDRSGSRSRSRSRSKSGSGSRSRNSRKDSRDRSRSPIGDRSKDNSRSDEAETNTGKDVDNEDRAKVAKKSADRSRSRSRSRSRGGSRSRSKSRGRSRSRSRGRD